MSMRTLMLANALFRLGYGVGALVAPSAMAAEARARGRMDADVASGFVLSAAGVATAAAAARAPIR